MEDEEKYWIVEKFDSAIMGFVSGETRQETMAGPFDYYDQAWEAKREYRSFGCYYYTIVKSKTKPKSTSDSYVFVDADREFEDC